MQEDAPLVVVRLRVVKLLGHLGGKLNRNLVTGEDFHNQAAVSFNLTRTLWVFGPCSMSDGLRTLDT